MTVLTDALERIIGWYGRHLPDIADSFLPGLSDNEIQEHLNDTGISLPEEIYELYRWRNGTTEEVGSIGIVFPTMSLLPLEESLERYNELIQISYALDDNDPIKFEGDRLFPFLESDGDYLAVPVAKESKISSRILWIPSELTDIRLMYSSLTSMMLTLAECYDVGAYYLNDEGLIEGIDERVAEVVRKHNADINEEILAQAQSLLTQEITLTREVTSRLFNTLGALTRFKDPRAIDLLVDTLYAHIHSTDQKSERICFEITMVLGYWYDPRVVPPLILALNSSSNAFQFGAVRSLSNLCEEGHHSELLISQLREEAVQPLIEALRNDDNSIRTHAAAALKDLGVIDEVIEALAHDDSLVRQKLVWVLGETKDPRAVESLTRLLEDPILAVRRAAQKALSKLNQDGDED